MDLMTKRNPKLNLTSQPLVLGASVGDRQGPDDAHAQVRAGLDGASASGCGR